MELNRLVAVIGQRKNAPDVERLVADLGGKLPLPAKAEGYFTAKEQDVELAWHNEVLAPAFYPPQREGRKPISYVTSIWFPPSAVQCSGLAAPLSDISPDMPASAWAALPGVVVSRNRLGTTAYSVPVGEQVSLRIAFDENGRMERRWALSLREHDHYAYVRSSEHAHAFSPWDPAWPEEQADLPMGMFMAWCIDRGKIGERHLRDHAALVDAVRARTMTGRAFLYQVAFCNEVWSWDVSADLKGFAYSYLLCLCHRNSSTPLLGRADRCGVNDDFMAVFSPHFQGRGLEAADTWENYERFACFLDARYRDHALTALQTEITPALLHQVQEVYRAAQERMAALPPPTARLQHCPPVADQPMLPPSKLSLRLLGLLGRLSTEPEVLAFTTELKLTIPSVTWNTYVDAPRLGFFLDLVRPWTHGRLGPAFAADKAALNRKKTKLVAGVEFTAEGYSQIGNSTGNFLLCSGFHDVLPLGFRFDEDLTAADVRMGPDGFGEHNWDTYGGDGSLSRRWVVQGVEGGPPGEYLVLAAYQQHRLMALRILLR
jgi:hypothetical protein